MEILKQHDIILTTYAEVMRSYPKNEPPIECQTVEQKMAWWKDVFETQRGILHRMMWLRVVLDEAQAIKNHTGRTSIACRALIARHKWALSGTPIMNSLTELYPYFKFLGVPHTGSFKIFKHNYCDTKDAENTERLLVRLSQFMIRRTHADRMFNAPILKLPQADQATFWCEFNPVERIIYDIVHERFTKTINMWQAGGQLEKSYSNALVMLLRLRQLTAHVLMLQFVMRDLLEVEDIERIKDVVKEQAVDSSTRRGRTIIAIRKQLEQHAIVEKKKAADRAAAKAAGKDFEDIEEDAEPTQEEPEPDEAASPQPKKVQEQAAAANTLAKTTTSSRSSRASRPAIAGRKPRSAPNAAFATRRLASRGSRIADTSSATSRVWKCLTSKPPRSASRAARARPAARRLVASSRACSTTWIRLKP
jgi:hypothetical protein